VLKGRLGGSDGNWEEGEGESEESDWEVIGEKESEME